MAKKAVDRRPAAGGDCWLVVHELHDRSAPWLAGELAALAGPHGPAVRPVPLPALMAWVRWRLQVDRAGSACTLDAPGLSLQAGCVTRLGAKPGPPRMRLAGVINRCGPVALPASAPDADYKSAEWNALLMAWLHGLPVPVLNRPRCDNVLGALASTAVWRQRAARFGLPIWPLALTDGPAHPAPLCQPAAWPGLLVVGGVGIEPESPSATGAAPGWTASARRAAARAAAGCGCDLLAWTGSHDSNGHWRVAAATAWPDLRPFGPPAVQALARLMGLKLPTPPTPPTPPTHLCSLTPQAAPTAAA